MLRELPPPGVLTTAINPVVKDKWRRCKIRKEAKLVAFRENDLAGTGFLRQNFPIRFIRVIDRCEPHSRVSGIRYYFV